MQKISLTFVCIGIFMVIMLFVFEIVDFYNDYKCSTTKDINWFMENNCMRYVEREIRNK